MTWQPILPPTVQQISGSGGIHLLYRVPPPYYIKTPGPAAHPLAAGVDTRGDGGQIIVAPSRNVHGPYQWVPGRGPWDRPPAAVPPALLAELREKGILVPPSARAAPVPAVLRPPAPGLDRPPAAVLLEKYMAPGGARAAQHLRLPSGAATRDNGYSLIEAAAWMLRYQQALDSPANRYTAEEALDSLRSAYQRSPRRAWAFRGAPDSPGPRRRRSRRQEPTE